MSILKRGADIVYTFRFIRMLVLDWKSWDAYKQGIIDEKGKRIKSQPLDTSARKDAYTPFIRLCANLKRLLSKIPLVGTALGSFAAALFLIKEKYGLQDNHLEKIMDEFGFKPEDILAENNQWFMLDDGTIAPGVYRIKSAKICNRTLDEIILPKDQIKINNGSPVGEVFGIKVYEASHVRTGQQCYISTSEIYK